VESPSGNAKEERNGVCKRRLENRWNAEKEAGAKETSAARQEGVPSEERKGHESEGGNRKNGTKSPDLPKTAYGGDSRQKKL